MPSYITENDILQMSLDGLIAYLAKLCEVQLPVGIETTEDMKTASMAIARLGPIYSYLVNMKMRVNIKKRICKKDKEQKDAYEELLAREVILDAYIDQAKMLYNTTSRMISIRQMMNEELKHLRGTI